jgi:hypothetical protein
MAPSLRSYLPKLSELLGLTPIALYERQRELVRAGLLKSEGTRGPGAGVRLSAESIAVLLISALATDNLSQVAERTSELAAATSLVYDENSGSPPKRIPCPVTGASRFKDVLTKIIADPQLAKRASRVTVRRDVREADIMMTTLSMGNSQEMKRIYFTPRRHSRQPQFGRRGISVTARMEKDTLIKIANDLARDIGAKDG